MTLILTHSQISDLLDRNQIREAVEHVFAGLASGDYDNPAPRGLAMPDHGVALPMVATGGGMTVVKLLSDVPANRSRDLPTQRSTIVVTSADTGECVALLDGRAITAARTAAASAVATDHLAERSSSVLGLIGAGNLAVEHAFSIAAVRDIDRIVVWSRSADTVNRFRSRVGCLGVPVVDVAEPEEVFDGTDIVCTLTPSKNPIAFGDWFRPGQHINAVGAPPRPDHREIDGSGMARARLVVDSVPTVMSKSGGVLLAIAEGLLSADDVHAEIGSVIVGDTPGRQSRSDITLFESVGLAVQDLVTAGLVIEHAQTIGLGAVVTMSG